MYAMMQMYFSGLSSKMSNIYPGSGFDQKSMFTILFPLKKFTFESLASFRIDMKP